MCAEKDDDGKKQQYGREETTKHTADTREEKTEKTTSPVFFELQLPGPVSTITVSSLPSEISPLPEKKTDFFIRSGNKFSQDLLFFIGRMISAFPTRLKATNFCLALKAPTRNEQK